VVLGYLGRVLDGAGDPVGTCFQVAPGVVVTAWHVLADIGAASDNSLVKVDPLAGGDRFEVTVARVDPVHDLAVLTSGTRLPGTAGPLTATDQMALRAGVTVTGHAVPDDPGHSYRFLNATGEWAGWTTRDDAVPLGRMISATVVPGMSGAPVIRDDDGAVAGVVSGRYNSTDGWLADTVWVARTEDLAVLLAGIAEIPMKQPPLAGPVDVLLTVTAGRVRLTGPGFDAFADHGGVRASLAEAVNETRRSRARVSLPVRGPAETQVSAGDLSLSRAARLLGESFLPEPVRSELGKVLAAAERAHQPVRLGLAVPPGLAGLPWEALPGPDGRSPLALHPLVSLYRRTDTAAGRVLPGPLRIVIAIAAPDTGGAVLDYERELRNMLAAVRAARQDAADVRVVPFATCAAIREELDRGAAHVLHISGHGSPGTLNLENDDGSARPVTADELTDQAIPPGKMPPVITLSACYTDAAASQDSISFMARLCQRGAAAVIATETSITDTYATRLLARVYGTLAQASDPDVVAALAEARRQVQAELETSPDRRDTELAGLGEWAAVTILAATGTVPVLDPGRLVPALEQPSRPQVAGLAGRQDWYFVGRRPEQRRWPADLTGTSLAGIVICGIGGTGKTTLAAEITTRILDREPGRILVSLTGPLTLESLLGAVIITIRRELLIRGQEAAEVIRALDVAARADLGWQDRLAILRGHVLDHVPVLLLLDNFEYSLRPDGDAGYAVGDEVLARLLAAWVADPGRSRLLVTCRYRFALPAGAEQALSFRQLGALSRAETMKLAWSLPALDKLDEGQLEQVWRLAGGHPRSLEYLDALLSGGQARYPDVTARLDAAIARRLSAADRGQWLASRTSLEGALAETVALAADDVLLKDLLGRLAGVRGAADLLLGVSVYREPVSINAVLFQGGQPDPDAEDIPDRTAASRQITSILDAAGITVGESFDLAAVPGDVRAQLAPHIAELDRRPVPPFRPLPGLPEQLAACQAASLLTISEAGQQPWFFVHRWTATELAERAALEPGQRLAEVHRQAAGYWRWRVQMWPQDKAADVHDLLEARYHLLQAGDAEDAGQVTEWACDQLDTWGAWDQEAALIHDTLVRLPADSPRRAAWIHQLGILAQARGDFDEAARQYQRSLDIEERLGDQAGLATSYFQLGILAQHRGDYDEAARQYHRSLDIEERLGNQAGLADSYFQLGILAQDHGDYDEAARQYQRSLDIEERLGNQAGIAISYSQLGNLEEERGGSLAAAVTWHVRALVIRLRLGVPQPDNNLRRLAAYRRELGAGPFTSLLTQVAGGTDLAETITSLLGQLDETDDSTA
jgi:tetratricopeptide (TPR) repeat protein